MSRNAVTALKVVNTVAPIAGPATTANQISSMSNQGSASLAIKPSPQREERISARKYNAPPTVPGADRPSPASSASLGLDSAMESAAVVQRSSFLLELLSAYPAYLVPNATVRTDNVLVVNLVLV